VKRVARRMAEAEGRALLAKVGLADKAEAYPTHLSGGQRQRVAIARALAMGPAVMLLDEVTSALDPELVGEVLNVIEQLAEEGMTMVIVTHEIAFAHEVADQVAFISDGVIAEIGPPASVLEQPENPRTRDLLARRVAVEGPSGRGRNAETVGPPCFTRRQRAAYLAGVQAFTCPGESADAA